MKETDDDESDGNRSEVMTTMMRTKRMMRMMNMMGIMRMIRMLRMTMKMKMRMVITSSTAQGGGGSFKNRKPIGEVGCCESGVASESTDGPKGA